MYSNDKKLVGMGEWGMGEWGMGQKATTCWSPFIRMCIEPELTCMHML